MAVCNCDYCFNSSGYFFIIIVYVINVETAFLFIQPNSGVRARIWAVVNPLHSWIPKHFLLFLNGMGASLVGQALELIAQHSPFSQREEWARQAARAGFKNYTLKPMAWRAECLLAESMKTGME